MTAEEKTGLVVNNLKVDAMTNAMLGAGGAVAGGIRNRLPSGRKMGDGASGEHHVKVGPAFREGERAEGGEERRLPQEPAESRNLYSRGDGESEVLNQPADSDNVGGRHEGYTSREDAERAVAIFNREQAASGGKWNIRLAESSRPEEGGGKVESRRNSDHLVGQQRLAHEIARLFGRRIVVIETDGANAPSFNGFVNSSRWLADYIFIHRDSPRPHLLTVGHELWHHLYLSAPKLAETVRKELADEIRNWDTLRKGKKGYPEEEVFDELMGDFLGDSLIEPDFWKRLENRNPEVFSRLASAVKPMLDQLLSALRAAGFGSDAHLSDIERARNILADAVVEFQKNPFSDSKIGPYEFNDPNENFYIRASDQKYREIDRQWWKDFAAWREGNYKSREPFDFGPASDELILAGFPDAEIVLPPHVLDIKPTSEKHPFPVTKLFNLPKKLRDPVMVFRSRTVADAMTALTEIDYEGENLLVAVHFRERPGGTQEISSIQSVYPKNNRAIIGWIHDGLATYYHKEKAHNWLFQLTTGSNSRHAWVQLQATENVKTNEDVVK